jgi:hypothetical protein
VPSGPQTESQAGAGTGTAPAVQQAVDAPLGVDDHGADRHPALMTFPMVFRLTPNF